MTSNFDLKGKAREWFVNTSWDGDKHFEVGGKWNRRANPIDAKINDNDEIIHVIEKAYADKLRADLEVAKEALTKIVAMDENINRKNRIPLGTFQEWCFVAREALAKIKE